MIEVPTTELVLLFLICKFIIFNKIAVSTKKSNYYQEPIRELVYKAMLVNWELSRTVHLFVVRYGECTSD